MQPTKRMILSILVALVAFPLLGQEAATARYKKLRIGLSFSPEYCSRILTAEPSYQQFSKNRDALEVPKLGFSTGINFLLPLHRNIDFESGIFYSDKGYKTKSTTLRWVSPEAGLPASYHSTYRYQYFDVPVKLNYYLTTSKIRFFVTTGMLLNIFNRQQIKLTLTQTDGSRNSTVSENDLGFSRIGFSVLAGMGTFYTISDRIVLKFQPVYKQSISSLTSSEAVKEKLYSIGIDVGFYYSFKK